MTETVTAADGTKIAERWGDVFADAVKGLTPDTQWKDSTVVELIEELSRAEAELARLQWQPVTPENLPNPGDEVLSCAYGEFSVQVVPEPMLAQEDRYRWAVTMGWTCFRPINPPAPLKETASPGSPAPRRGPQG